ncbi:sugar transferase [Roseobacteraceae bacterium S113]
MYDFGIANSGDTAVAATNAQTRSSSLAFRASKRAFDVVFSLLLLPPIFVVSLILLVFNPMFNKGSLFYVQPRMGRNCRAFPALKFRTMQTTRKVVRGAHDPLEVDRITKLGALMRKSRIDELPQILNVLRGEMSLIGPRPDYFHHARRFVSTIPGYRERHSIRPGISGLAQTELGYAAGREATVAKVNADLYYINNASFRLEVYIFWRTLVTVFLHRGA